MPQGGGSEPGYGSWPLSGEIDLMESRGNSPSCWGMRNCFSSTLHWGPRMGQDAAKYAHEMYTHGADVGTSDGFTEYRGVCRRRSDGSFDHDKQRKVFSENND